MTLVAEELRGVPIRERYVADMGVRNKELELANVISSETPEQAGEGESKSS
jgi:hypothetical protein